MNEEAKEMLSMAQKGCKYAEEDLISLIKTQYMGRRIGRYLSRNRQAENEDIKQEFMIGVSLNIHKARMDVGDPVEFIIQCGIYRVKSYLRKCIRENTMQTCNICGAISRLNQISKGRYQCLKCGSVDITTMEVADKNELILEGTVSDFGFEEDLVSDMFIKMFEATLVPNSNVQKVYALIQDGFDRDNPLISNYINAIAYALGGCSNQNVVQILKKLQSRLTKFMVDNDQ